MSKSKENLSFSTILFLGVIFLSIIAILFTSSRLAKKESVSDKPASAQTFKDEYPITLTTSASYNKLIGPFSIKADWNPPTGNDSTESIFFWKGEVCKSFAGGYKPGDLIWSYGTINKSTYTYSSNLFEAGDKYCIQIWKDFYGGVVGSNPSVVHIPYLSASVLKTRKLPVTYGLRADWVPPTNDTGSSVFFWNGACKSAEGGYGPGDLIWSYPTTNKTTYSYYSKVFQPGKQYCVQIWKDFYGGVAYTKPVSLTIK